MTSTPYVGVLTADARITWPDTGGLRSLSARDLRTDEVRWTVEIDPDCQIPDTTDSARWLQTLPDTMLLAQTCHGDAERTARVTAFDADTGQRRWTHEQPVPVRQGITRVTVAEYGAPFGHLRGGHGDERSNGSVAVVARTGDNGHLVLDSATGEVLAEDVRYATGCGGLSHYTEEAVAVLCPGEAGTLRAERHTLDGDPVASAEIPARLAPDGRNRKPLSTSGVDWLALSEAGVASWPRRTSGGQTRHEVGVAGWDGGTHTIALPDTVGGRVTLLAVPGALLAFEVLDNGEVIGLR